MSGQQRVFRERIRSTQSLKKIFRAMELIAASRIGKARERVTASSPYSRAMTRAVSAVATHTDGEHPLIGERPDSKRTALLLLTSDRGMAGAYSANILREGERTIAELAEEGKEVDVYTVGRRGSAYFQFRGRDVMNEWVGSSDAPTFEQASDIAETLLTGFETPEEEGGVGELRIVYTHFVNMVRQDPRVVRLLPLEIVDGVSEPGEEPLPLYDFEPSSEEALNGLLPRYVQTRIYDCLLQSAASELAARQSAMHTATDNAEEIIRNYTRLANQARQGEITQEINEIVSGADALAASSN